MTAAVVAGCLLLLAALIAAARYRAFESRGLVGIDYQTFVAFGARWLATGSMYLPAQLAGPYAAEPLPHVPALMPSLYPPTAAYLFAALTVLPALVWWLVPGVVVAYALARSRPRAWGWAAIAALLCLPASSSVVIAGGSTMWVAAGVAAGLLWGWPAALLLLRPNLAWLALVGLRRPRRFVLGLVAFALVSLPLMGQWLVYPAVVLHSDATGGYTPFDPLAVVPLVAWLARRAAAPRSPGSATSWRLPSGPPWGWRVRGTPGTSQGPT